MTQAVLDQLVRAIQAALAQGATPAGIEAFMRQRMIVKYALIERGAWDGRQAVHESPGALIVSQARLAHHVEAMTGRGFALAIPSVARRLRTGGRVFVASERGRAGGVVVEDIRQFAGK
jgi:hypothetical protein